MAHLNKLCVNPGGEHCILLKLRPYGCQIQLIHLRNTMGAPLACLTKPAGSSMNVSRMRKGTKRTRRTLMSPPSAVPYVMA